MSAFASSPSAPPLGGETKLTKDEMADLAAIPAPRRRSKALLVLGIGVPLVALAALGYHFGKGHLPVVLESPTLGSPTPSQPPTAGTSSETAPAPTPDETGQGLRPPPTPEASEANDAQEALVAFLGAPDWQARSAFVLSPDEVRPAMEKHAKEHGDGPIPASSVHLNEDQSAPPVFVFYVCTKAMPDGFPVPVTLTDEGPKIDWESFTAFNDDHFHKLLTGPADQTGIFSVLVKPEVGAEPSPHWFRYRLSVPMPGRQATGWVRKDSVTLARIRSVFEGANGYDKETVDAFVSQGGVPLQLAVMKRRTNDGQEFIEVVDLVAVKWGPPPKD
jgi:hypothetical protein